MATTHTHAHALASLRASGLGAAWHLAAVDVTDLATGQHYRFIANRWLSKTDGDRQTEVDLYPEGAAGANQVTYNIEVITSNIQGAGEQHR